MPGLDQLALISVLRRYVHSACSSRDLVPHVGIFWGGLQTGWLGGQSLTAQAPSFPVEERQTPDPPLMMSNPASPGHMQAHCYSRKDAAISTHSLPNPGALRWYRSRWGRLWALLDAQEQYIAWERCVTKQARSATGQRRSPTQNGTPVATSPAPFSFMPCSEVFGRAVGERGPHGLHVRAQRAIARQPSSLSPSLPKTPEGLV